MEHQVANPRVKWRSRGVIGELETEREGRTSCWGAWGAGAGASGVFLFTTSTQELGTQAAGPVVLGLVANRTGGGPDLVRGVVDPTAAVCAGGEGGPEEPVVLAKGAAEGVEV